MAYDETNMANELGEQEQENLIYITNCSFETLNITYFQCGGWQSIPLCNCTGEETIFIHIA